MLKKAFFLLFWITSPLLAINSEYLNQLHRTDVQLMNRIGIKVKESFPEVAIPWEWIQDKLFTMGVNFLHKDHDVWNAYRIFSYLTLQSQKEEYLFYLGQCYYFMGELYYKGYIREYYQKAYDIFERLVNKNDKKLDYVKWQSYAAAKVGGFIRSKEKGKFSGLSYLRESISLNDDILDDIDKNNEDALLTEGEYQIETDSIPIFGGSEEKGVKLFRKVIQINPNNMRAHLLLGKYYYMKKGRPAEGLPYILKAIEIYDKNLTSHDMVNFYARIFLEMHLIRIYESLGKPDKVWEHLQKHLSLLPRSPSGLKALINYLLNIKKDKENACLVAKRVRTLDPYVWGEDRVQQVCR